MVNTNKDNTSPGPKRKHKQFTATMKKTKVASFSNIKNATKVGRNASSDGLPSSIHSKDSAKATPRLNTDAEELPSLISNIALDTKSSYSATHSTASLPAFQQSHVGDKTDNPHDTETESEESDGDGIVMKGSRQKSVNILELNHSRLKTLPSANESSQQEAAQELPLDAPVEQIDNAISGLKLSDENLSVNVGQTLANNNVVQEKNDTFTESIHIDNQNTKEVNYLAETENEKATEVEEPLITETLEVGLHTSENPAPHEIAVDPKENVTKQPVEPSDTIDTAVTHELKDKATNNALKSQKFYEATITPHDSTDTLTQASPKPPVEEVVNSLNMHKMFSVLSQSTGQERKFTNKNETATNNQELDEEQTTLPHEPKVQIQPDSRKDSCTSTPNSTVSTTSTDINQDSLIFQQSGLTLYNFNTQPSTKNLNPTNHYNLSRNMSQQSLKRQESYLTFRVPDNLQKNLQMSSNNEVLDRKSLQAMHTNNVRKPEEPEKKQSLRENSPITPNKTQPPKSSLLSQQKKSQDEEKKQATMLDIDLSSYLSTQEPEIDSRTQQKLWLQRENVATLNDSEYSQHAPAAIVNQSTRFQYEQNSREFLHIRRFLNPMLDSLTRINESGAFKRRMSIDNSATETSTLTGKSFRPDASIKSKFLSTSVTKNMGFTMKDNSTIPDVTFNNDLTDYKDIITALWNKNCDEFKGEDTQTLQTNTPSSIASSNTQQYHQYQPQQFNNGVSPQYKHPTLNAFGRSNHTSFGQSHFQNASSSARR